MPRKHCIPNNTMIYCVTICNQLVSFSIFYLIYVCLLKGNSVLEILSPAGSPEGVVAAIQNGADAIYLGLHEFNSHVKAKNFTFSELGHALEYCRIRGVKAYLALNSLISDPDLPIIEHHIKEASRFGINGAIIQDLGLMRVVRQAVPDLRLHASSRLGVHSLEGVKMAAALGFSRVTLARELSRRKIAHICRYSPIEIEVHVHGFQCISYAGQCYMSAIIGGFSDSHGQCTMPCQLAYTTPPSSLSYPLALKESCLARYLTDIEALGVTSIKIGGNQRRPEYSAIVTGTYSRAISRNRAPSENAMNSLQNVFARQGFTDGYYTDTQGSQMFGVQDEDTRSDTAFFSATRKSYLNGEFQRVPVRFVGTISADKRVKVAAADDKNNSAVAYGPVPEKSFHRELTTADLQTQLYKTEGTPFICKGVKGKVDPGLFLPLSEFNGLRTDLLSDILEQRKPITISAEGDFTPSPQIPNREQPPVITVSVSRLNQLSSEMEELSPKILYIPITELDYELPLLRKFLENDNIVVSVMLPRIIHDSERKRISGMLEQAISLGIRDALIGNIGQVQFIKSRGFSARGDFGLNIYNTETLFVFQKLGLRSATLPFELSLSEIRNISKPIDTELITYGRLPLMFTENCIIRNATEACTCDNFSGITSEGGAVYPIEPEFGCRNVILNSKKLFMGDKRRTVASLGLWAERLSFTTENAIECVTIMKRYMKKGDFTPPGYTRGLYYTGVERA